MSYPPSPVHGSPRRRRRSHFDTIPTPAMAQSSTVRYGSPAIRAPASYRVAVRAGRSGAMGFGRHSDTSRSSQTQILRRKCHVEEAGCTEWSDPVMMRDAQVPGTSWRIRPMADENHTLWDRLVRELGIAPDLREHIENMAKREGISPWDYILLVLRRDADHASESRNRRK
jgi:hypothetical protein